PSSPPAVVQPSTWRLGGETPSPKARKAALLGLPLPLLLDRTEPEGSGSAAGPHAPAAESSDRRSLASSPSRASAASPLRADAAFRRAPVAGPTGRKINPFATRGGHRPPAC